MSHSNKTNMKKYFSLLAGLILLVFTACQSDELVNGGRNGEVAASFSVQLPDDGHSAVTRAAGDGVQVNRCIMEIYLNDELYKREVSAVQADGLTAKFDVRLVTSQTYNFVFWADHVESVEGEKIKTDLHYNTADLRNIAMIGTYNGSSKDDTRDAFSASLEKLVTNAFSESVELTRPFGQLNIKTEDLDLIPENQREALTPTTAMLSFENLYTGFNAATGDLIGAETKVFYQDAADVVDADGNLTVDYLFAPKNASEQHLVNMKLTVNNAAGKLITTKDLNIIPVQRNYKTNVTGNLLTVDGTVEVTVKPTFTSPDLSEKVKEVALMSEVTEALKTNTNVVVTTPPTKAETISLPKYDKEDVAVSITLPETTQDITINYSSESDEGSKNAPKELKITAPSATKVIIEAEKSTVTLNGVSYGTVEATTADNTLIVGGGLTVNNLILKKGSVRLYGKIAAIEKTTDWSNGKYKLYRCVSSQQDVANLLADNVSGYERILIDRPVSGILDFGGEAQLSKPMVISQNVEISNLKIVSDAATVLSVIGDDLKVILRGTAITNTGVGTGSYPSCGIECVGLNPHLELYNSTIITTGREIRGITVGADAQSVKASSPYILLDATSIRTELAAVGNKAYTDEQVNAFKSRPYSRGINYYYMTGKHVLDIRNKSSIEGFYYAMNQTFNGGQIVANVSDSYLDGRSAFNVRNSYNEINVSKSCLVGRNYFTGSTEGFGAIVLNYDDKEHAADYSTVNITDTEIYSRTNPNTESNYQYSIDIRSRYNMVNLKGETKLYELVGESDEPRLDYFISHTGKEFNKINVASTVTVQGKEGATVCQP